MVSIELVMFFKVESVVAMLKAFKSTVNSTVN